MKAAAILGAVALALAAAGGAEAQYRMCNHNEWWGAHAYINTHMELSWSNQGTGAPDSASWDTRSVDTFNKAWRGWWNLDTTNPAVWLGPNATNNTYNSLPDFVSLFQKTNPMPGLAGQTQYFHSTIFSSVITEVDIRVLGATTLSTPPGLPPISPQSTCAHNDQTQGGVMIHELGHAYGYNHWFDWLSMMNSGQVDVLNCETPVAAGGTTSMALTPDALSSQCHDIQYGVAAGIDFGGTPVRQTCALTSGGCAGVLDTTTTWPEDAVLGYVVAEFTTFSNRDSYGAAVPYRILLSTNATVGASDVEIFRNGLTGFSAGATQFRRRTIVFNPQEVMPAPATTYYVLVQLDPDNVIAETRESNNVIDTRIRVRRE
jgi:hypothetical protein